jgi:hypothetical protein
MRRRRPLPASPAACGPGEEKAKAVPAGGVTAKLVADMTWSGFDDRGAPQPASAVALFEKAGGGWARSPGKAVNPESCADL